MGDRIGSCLKGTSETSPSPAATRSARGRLLVQLEHWLEVPMVVLGIAWLVLLIIEFTAGLSPEGETAGTIIWGLFLFDFALKFSVAPRKLPFLGNNWLTALSLLLPALRVFRIARIVRTFRLVRAARGLSFLRLITSMNRGLRALRITMRRRGVGYVTAFAVMVIFAAAAGMYAFERDEDPGLRSYASALWWTAMMITTVGTDYFPRSPEGRALCLVVAIIAFSIWGYITATLATFFVGRDIARPRGGSPAESLAECKAEIARLREAIEELSRVDHPQKQGGRVTEPQEE